MSLSNRVADRTVAYQQSSRCRSSGGRSLKRDGALSSNRDAHLSLGYICAYLNLRLQVDGGGEVAIELTWMVLAGPGRGADHAAEILGPKGGILVGEHIGLDVAKGRLGPEMDGVVEGLDDLFLEAAGARVCVDDGLAQRR